ncbi:MAG: BrnT family toxin [Candidatus Omnitrophica bacterium]|nr:BrnT family toxin [Candidatus Omnitrophota bacterium]
MRFEYDPKKACLNKEKHGVDFEQAKALWENEAVIIQARTTGECRSMIIGWIEERLYSCVFTVRLSRIRIISCRRSSSTERGVYHEKVER